MPQKYTVSSPGCESDYEDGEGTHYSVTASLGQGRVVRARQLKSQKDGTALVVLDPVDTNVMNENECTRKLRFFREHHSGYRSTSTLFKFANTLQYRMIVPFISGVTYLQLLQTRGRIKDIEQQIKLCFSLIAELKILHAKGLVFLDLKSDNVIYDEKTGKSYLIDGGLAVKHCEELPREFHVSEHNLTACYKSNYHIAPECWITPSSPFIPSPDPSMDIYSLGALLLGQLFCRELDEDILALSSLCVEAVPSKRPSLESLEAKLTDLLPKKIYPSFQDYTIAILHDKSDLLYRIIFHVADRFLLGEKIKFSPICPSLEGRGYLLSDQSLDEQQLYLELAGLTFFHYLATDKLADLNLQVADNFKLSLVADVLMIKSDEGVRGESKSAYPNIKCWKIDKQACVQTFANLVSQHSKLEGFAYNIENPVETARRLWIHLSLQTMIADQKESSRNDEENMWRCCIA